MERERAYRRLVEVLYALVAPLRLGKEAELAREGVREEASQVVRVDVFERLVRRENTEMVDELRREVEVTQSRLEELLNRLIVRRRSRSNLVRMIDRSRQELTECEILRGLVHPGEAVKSRRVNRLDRGAGSRS